MKACDLHTHSVFSDGTFTPTELIHSAESIGLSALALCDHNTVDGLPEFLNAAEDKSVEAVCGCEFSVTFEEKELHLLALFINEKHFAEISEMMQRYNRLKEESNINLIAALNKAGYNISYDQIKAQTPNGKFNRAHVAAELTRKGYTASIKEAFKTLLSKSGGYYKEPQRPDLFEMLEFISSIGAVSVLAHPFLNLDEERLSALLPLAKEKGLVAVECFYSLYDEETTKKSIELCDKFGLKYSGGSDFHGENKPDIRLGVGKGNLKIPYEWALNLKK